MRRARVVRATTVGAPPRSQAHKPHRSTRLRLPGLRLYTQYAGWADERWRHECHSFDAYEPHPRHGRGRKARVVGDPRNDAHLQVSFCPGGARTRAPAEIAPVMPTCCGRSAARSTSGLPIDGRRRRCPRAGRTARPSTMPSLVIAHAGIGSRCRAGCAPVLLPDARRVVNTSTTTSCSVRRTRGAPRDHRGS